MNGEQRSFDTKQSGLRPRYRDNFHPCFGGFAARAVLWDPEWPPQEEVPHAGTEWLFCGEKVRVLDGIPLPGARSRKEYRLSVSMVDGEWATPFISDLRPIPEEPETVEVPKAKLDALQRELDELRKGGG